MQSFWTFKVKAKGMGKICLWTSKYVGNNRDLSPQIDLFLHTSIFFMLLAFRQWTLIKNSAVKWQKISGFFDRWFHLYNKQGLHVATCLQPFLKMSNNRYLTLNSVSLKINSPLIKKVKNKCLRCNWSSLQCTDQNYSSKGKCKHLLGWVFYTESRIFIMEIDLNMKWK